MIPGIECIYKMVKKTSIICIDELLWYEQNKTFVIIKFLLVLWP